MRTARDAARFVSLLSLPFFWGLGTGLWAQTTPPTLVKAFTPSAIPVGGVSLLQFTITNTSATSSITGVGFTDTLPAGMAIATPDNLSLSCVGSFGIFSGVVHVSGITLGPADSCVVQFDVNGTSPGALINTTGAITSNESGPGGTASATLTVGFDALIPTLSPAGLAALSALLCAAGWLLSRRRWQGRRS
jgi:uncharacterized repeat protein (TIGR01451 family)